MAETDRPVATLPASYWNVPYSRNSLFTGREAILAQLRAALNTQARPVALAQPQAISGLGGIGKTQVAIEYAYRYREAYNAVFWVRADSRDLLISDFLLIAALLDLPQRNEQDQSLVVSAVLRWFDTHENWLLILDNADNLQVVSEFIPSGGKGEALLTTRAHSTGTVAQRIELEKMEAEEAILLLLRRAKQIKVNTPFRSVPEALRMQARAIVEAVDGLPLAIDQAGAYIEETDCSMADYLRFYQTRRQRLLRLRGEDSVGHPEPVATTWSLSFEKVQQANPAAAELLRLCAFLHPDEIPQSMIMEGAAELEPSLQTVAQDEFDLNEAIGELHRYSLIKRDPERKILNVHRLVQAVIKDTMDEEKQREWAKRVVRMVNTVFPSIITPLVDVTVLPACQQFQPHAQICASFIIELDLVMTEAASLLHKLGVYFSYRGLYSEAEAFYQRALTIREQTAGPDSLDVSQILVNLCLLYKELGQYETSIAFARRALSIREQILGPDHIEVARSLNNLAVLYMTQGNYELAEQFYQRALRIFENEYGPNHINLTVPLNNMAANYAYQEKFAQAQPIFQRVLSIREQALGPDHPSVARSMFNLAKVYQDQEQYDKAEPLHEKALAIWEKMLGPDHPDVAQSLSELGALYTIRGRYEQAEALLLRAISIREQSMGERHPDFAETLYFLALLYYEQGQYQQAEALFQQALAILEEKLGAEHLFVLRVSGSYATLLATVGRKAEAEALSQLAQTIRAKKEA